MFGKKKGSNQVDAYADTYEGLPIDRRYSRQDTYRGPEKGAGDYYGGPSGNGTRQGGAQRRSSAGWQGSSGRSGIYSGQGLRQSSYARPGVSRRAEEYGQQGPYDRRGGYGQGPYDRRDGYGQGPYNRRDGYGQQGSVDRRDVYAAQTRRGPQYAGGNDPRRDRPYRRGEELNAPAPRRRRKKRPFLTFLKVLLIMLVLVGGAAFIVLGRMDHNRLGRLIRNAGLSTSGAFTNYVLYGVDSRTGGLTSECHSDAIIIVSLNRDTKEIRLASVYRDTYLDNTNGEFRKATECYYFGGPERSINMLNKNLDLDISDYITVNFNAVVKAVDLLGGIDLEVTDEEVQYINGYCVENEQVTGASYTPLTSSGYVHLTGTQALAYCRIRFTEGWDYKRTERQRTVLTLIYKKAVEKGPIAMVSIINTMLPEISTSMNSVEILALAADLGRYKLGDQCGFPFDKTGADLAAGDCVVPVNLANNVTQLHAFLFGDLDYVPSETVQSISNQISNDTGIW